MTVGLRMLHGEVWVLGEVGGQEILVDESITSRSDYRFRMIDR